MTAGDGLLHVISVRQEMTWPVFKKVADAFLAMGAPPSTNATLARAGLLRALDALAHVEVSRGVSADIRVFVAPSSMARLPTDTPAAVLAGARSLDCTVAVEKALQGGQLRLDIHEQHCELGALLPSRLCVHADSEESLAQCAKSLGLLYQATPPSWALSHLSTEIEQVLSSLRWNVTSEMQWRHADFDVQSATFRSRKGSRPDRCLTRYLDPVKGSYRYYLWRGDACAEVEPDWGRYCALRDACKSVFYYDRTSSLLAVPRTVPLPRLLARSLTLCSGYSPRAPRKSPFSDPSSMSVFQMIPRAVVDRVAGALGQDVSPVRLDL
jgi:hypothetical protein